MTWPYNLKTVFVIDHSPLMSRPCDTPLELDVFNKSRTGGPASFIPVPPVCKSMWTCAVEASFEYCRIVWDIYPTGKQIKFVVSDHKAQVIGSWAPAHQNLNLLMNHFAQIGTPTPDSRSGECSVVHGLAAGLEGLTECTETQLEKLKSQSESGLKVINRGRVICIGTFRDDAYVRSVESFFQDTIVQINKRNFGPNEMPIHQCDLVLVNIYPNAHTSKIKEHPKLELSPVLTCEIISVRASRWLASRFCSLVLQHYELASTTVTGIPMKEEQNASSSANYDVEIFHPVAAHADILKLKNESALFIMKEGYDYKTVTLKWCTPRATSNSVEMWPCSSAHRISPVDVTSRPSSCLTNFLLGGRSVMLELPRGGSGSRTTSHMLAAHGGEIFLHSLLIGRSVIEDPPSISEGSGGRVTDYRIPDFGELMKENKLVPYYEGSPSTSPVQKAMARLERSTQYWPLTISSTMVFNLGSITEPLSKLIVCEELTDDEVVECKKVIYNLLAMETRNDPLPAAACAGHRGDRSGAKSSRREEQYRLLFNELEILLKRHCRSEQHKRVLACLLECRTKGTPGSVPPGTLPGVPVGATTPVKEPPESNLPAKLPIPDTPLSPPPAKVPILDLRSSSTTTPGRNLLDLWNATVTTELSRKQREFVGHSRSGAPAVKLYPNFEKDHEA